MAVTQVKELMGEGDRGADWTIESGRNYRRRFMVLTDNQADGPVLAGNAVGIKYGDFYVGQASSPGEVDTAAYCTMIRVDQVGDDGLQWIVELGYSWYNAFVAGGGPHQDPLEMPIEVTWGLRDHERVLQYDANGKAVLNTAGDPFDPPIVVDDPRMTMTVVRNEAQVNLGLILQYRNAVNSDSFAGFNPLYCRCINISPRSQFHQDAGWYYQTTYEIEFMPQYPGDGGNGYRKQILNMGMRSIGSNGNARQIQLNGVPVNQPMLLDSSGKLLKPTGTPYYKVYQAYPELPFAVFNFDPLAISGQRTGFV